MYSYNEMTFRIDEEFSMYSYFVISASRVTRISRIFIYSLRPILSLKGISGLHFFALSYSFTFESVSWRPTAERRGKKADPQLNQKRSSLLNLSYFRFTFYETWQNLRFVGIEKRVSYAYTPSSCRLIESVLSQTFFVQSPIVLKPRTHPTSPHISPENCPFPYPQKTENTTRHFFLSPLRLDFFFFQPRQFYFASLRYFFFVRCFQVCSFFLARTGGKKEFHKGIIEGVSNTANFVQCVIF